MKAKVEQQRTLLAQERLKQSTLRQQLDDKQHQIGVHRQTLESLMGERIQEASNNHYEAYQPPQARRDSYAGGASS